MNDMISVMRLGAQHAGLSQTHGAPLLTGLMTWASMELPRLMLLKIQGFLVVS